MKFKVENVQKGNEYKCFKNRLESITARLNVSYDYNKKCVNISYEEPYLIDDEVLKHKSNTKKEVLKEISVLRQIQFTTN